MHWQREGGREGGGEGGRGGGREEGRERQDEGGVGGVGEREGEGGWLTCVTNCANLPSSE